MKKLSWENVLSLIKSLKFNVFVLATLIVIVPILVIGTIFINVSTNEFFQNKLTQFQSNNTVLKNNIVYSGYLGKKQSKEVQAQIGVLAHDYNCRVQVVDKNNIIRDDTKTSDVGHTSISDNVFKALDGESVYDENLKKGYVEFAIPLVTTISTSENKIDSKIIGVLVTNYSTQAVAEYKHNISEVVYISELLGFIFALFMGWVFSRMVSRPVERVRNVIRNVKHKREVEDLEEVNDYTEIKKILEDFNTMIDNFYAEQEKRDEFVSNVSHELKTPITSMKVLADSLIGMEGAPEELYKEFLVDISKEIERENQIISDLLELVNTENAESELKISQVNINEILESVLKTIKPIAEEKNVEVVLESFRPIVADVDELKFARVITNLVENAVKYNKVDGTVTISLNSDHQYFYVTISDTGIGISEEDQERVFERFFRVDKARARETGGSGLGLAITKEIVKKHHGSIGVHSKEEEGTTFTVRIPLKYIEE